MSKRAFISFDYDHDEELKIALIGQSKNPDSPFSIKDFSIKEEIPYDWKERARQRIRGCDVVVVICGEHTNTANGVSTELAIAKEEHVPYFLLCGHPDRICVKPKSATYDDKIYKWTWDNIKNLLNGYR